MEWSAYTREPCYHQAAVARKYNINGLNVIPTFNVDGQFLFAQIAVGKDPGPLSFYSGLHDGEPDVRIHKTVRPIMMSKVVLSRTNYHKQTMMKALQTWIKLVMKLIEWRTLLIRIQHYMRSFQQMWSPDFIQIQITYYRPNKVYYKVLWDHWKKNQQCLQHLS